MQLNLKIEFYIIKLFLAIIIVINISCNEDKELNLTLGDDFIDVSTNITQVDTFDIKMSSVIVDSLITSNNEVALVGYTEDGKLGNITAINYSKIILPPSTYIDITADDKFDSLTLVLPFNSYSYGDTNLYQELDVFLLQEEMSRTGDAYNFYNVETVDYESVPIGHLRYLPRPNRDSVIEIRINDALGEDLFYKLLYDEEEVQNNDEFQKYIYGIAIVPQQSQNSCIMGFEQDEIALVLYTSRISSESDEESSQDSYAFESSGFRFSSIISDRIGTELNMISSQEESLSSMQTEDKTYIQAGTGILTKIEFPYLNSLYFNDNMLMLSAILIVGVDVDSYNKDFPESLSIYLTDEYNNFNIYNEDNLLSSAKVIIDEKYRLETYYAFDITSIIKDQIENGVDSDLSFLITIPESEFNTTLNTAILDASSSKESKTRLIINYIEV